MDEIHSSNGGEAFLAFFVSKTCEIKIVETSTSIFCVDVNRPAVLRISPEIKLLLTDGVGKSEQWIRQNVPRADEAIEAIRHLQSQGFLVAATAHEPKSSSYTVSKIALQVSSICNLACKYCYVDASEVSVKSKLMTEAIGKRSIDYFSNFAEGAGLELDFFGGEPLTNFKVIKSVVEYCRLKPGKFKFCLTTNATRVTPEIAKFLGANNFTVTVSIDGSPDVHNENRPLLSGRPSFDNVIRGLRLLENTQGVHVSSNAVVTQRTPDCEEIVQALRAIGVKNISTTIVSAPNDLTLDLDASSMGHFIESERRVCDDLLANNFDEDFRYLPLIQYIKILATGKPRKYRCGVGREMVAVGLDGEVYPCHRFLGNREMSLGNIGIDIDVTKKLAYSIMDSEHGIECRVCWARNICGGPCISDSYVYTGSINGVPVQKCDRIRSLIENSIRVFGDLMCKDKDRLVRYVRKV